MNILHRQETIFYKLVFVDVIKKCSLYKKNFSTAERTGRLNLLFPWSKGELIPSPLLLSEIKTEFENAPTHLAR